MQKFVKGYTNNHLTWVMVDATDFATPESALSAATKIKIYGKVKGATGVNFVSSGTGSLTNDIQHVGASALGIYTIALVKADLSDASAAWYDQYIISLSATGAAYQTIIADGGIMESYLSDLLSDIGSDVIVMSGILSDTLSAVILTQSMASDAASAAQQGNSRVLLVQSRLSDLDSRLVSDVSDILSAAVQTNSRVILVQSRLSDLDSRLVSDVSDILSTVRGNSATLSDVDSALTSQFSDLLSKLASISSMASDAHSAAVLAASHASDVYSAITSNRAEPGQGAPGASITSLAKLDYLYKAWRNRTTQTADQYSLYGDDGVTVDHKATFSDDNTTADRGEVATGP